MSRWTKRPQNACRQCGDTWYPRGKDVSHCCPRCGSNDVELAIMALFRALAALVLGVFLAIKALFELAVAVIAWLVRQVGRWCSAVRQWLTIPSAARTHPVPGPTPGATPLAPARPFTPATKRSGPPGWVSRTWSRTRGAVGRFFAWVASVNDDITGVNDSPHPPGRHREVADNPRTRRPQLSRRGTRLPTGRSPLTARSRGAGMVSEQSSEPLTAQDLARRKHRIDSLLSSSASSASPSPNCAARAVRSRVKR
jgi:hypothetical protein